RVYAGESEGRQHYVRHGSDPDRVSLAAALLRIGHDARFGEGITDRDNRQGKTNKDSDVRMNKTWYKKTILSYIPTLYLTIAIIVFISIFIIGEVSMKEADRTNRYSLEYIAQSTETSMRLIERRVIEELQFGGALYAFFETNNSSDPRVVNYEANK